MQSEGWFRGSFKGRRMICLGLSGSGKIGPREKATGDNLDVCLGLSGSDKIDPREKATGDNLGICLGF